MRIPARRLLLAAICVTAISCSSSATTCHELAFAQAEAEELWAAAFEQHAEADAALTGVLHDHHHAEHDELLNARAEVIAASARAFSACG